MDGCPCCGGHRIAPPYPRVFEEILLTDLGNLESSAGEMRRTGYATIERLVDGIPSLGIDVARWFVGTLIAIGGLIGMLLWRLPAIIEAVRAG